MYKEPEQTPALTYVESVEVHIAEVHTHQQGNETGFVRRQNIAVAGMDGSELSGTHVEEITGLPVGIIGRYTGDRQHPQ